MKWWTLAFGGVWSLFTINLWYYVLASVLFLLLLLFSNPVNNQHHKISYIQTDTTAERYKEKKDDTLDWIVLSSLVDVGLYSEDMFDMLLGIAAVESDYGQTSDNVFQVKAWVADDMYQHWLKYKPVGHPYISAAIHFDEYYSTTEEMLNTKEYCTVMAALHLLRTCESKKITLPKKGDTVGQAKFWKKYYNTYISNGTVEQFIKKKKMYVK